MAITDYWDDLKNVFTEPVVGEASEQIYNVPWDIGKISAAFQREFVRDVNGVRIDEQITPAMLALVLIQLEFMTNYLDAVSKEQVEDDRRWPGSRSPDVEAWRERLQGYHETVQACLNEGNGEDPACTYDAVVSPLILGYFAQGDQWVKRPADITFPYRWMNSLSVDAQVRTELGPWSLFGLFAEAAIEKVPEVGAVLWDVAKDQIDTATQFVKDQYNWQKKIMPLALVAGSILGIAYLSSRYGGRAR